jgi:hypothetical protein
VQRPRRQLSLAGYSIGLILGALLVWGLSAAWVECFPSSVLPARYARNIAVQKMMHECAGNDVAIFGDSRARSGINPSRLTVPALNLAEGAYNPAVDFYRVRNMLQCEHRPRLVILSYSVLLFRLLAPFLMNDFFIDRLLSDQEIQEIVDLMNKTHDWRIMAGHYDSVPPLLSLPVTIRTILYRTDFPLFYAPSMLTSLESGILPRWHANQQVYASTIRNRGQYPFDDSEKSDAVFQDVQISQYPRSAVMDTYFEKLLALLADARIPVLILTMPINQPTFDALGPDQREAHALYLHHFAALHPNVSVIDPVLAPWPSDMFADQGGHPNRRGQLEATRLLDRCINALLAQSPRSASPHPGDPEKCSMAYRAF